MLKCKEGDKLRRKYSSEAAQTPCSVDFAAFCALSTNVRKINENSEEGPGYY